MTIQIHVPVVHLPTLATVVVVVPTLAAAATAFTVPSFPSGDPTVSSICKLMALRGVGISFGIGIGADDCHDDHDNIDILQQKQQQLLSPSLSFIQQSNFSSDRLLFVRSLCSPRTWWGLMDVNSKAFSSLFQTSTMIQSLLGFLFPLLLLWMIDQYYNVILSPFHRSYNNRTRMMMTRMILRMKMNDSRHYFYLVSCVVFSPWSVGCIYQLISQFCLLIQSIRMQLKFRSTTLSRATTMLKERIKYHRAYRTSRYDVYLPSSLFSSNRSSNTSNTSTSTSIITTSNNNENIIQQQQQVQHQEAILFIPGASVSHEAYSELAGRLSDEGFVVAVLALEPIRLAHHHLGTDSKSMKRIMKRITTDIRIQNQKQRQIGTNRRTIGNSIVSRSTIDNNIVDNDNDKIITASSSLLPQQQIVEWSLMGHSMGAFAAMKLFSELVVDNVDVDTNKNRYNNNNDNNNSSAYTISNKLIMLGVAALFNPFLTDLSNHKNAQILIVQGTNDILVQMMQSSPGKQKEFDSYFPPPPPSSSNDCGGGITRTELIIGGTHAGFSSYRPSTFSDDNNNDDDDDDNDNDNLLLSEQHKQACDATVRFLRT